MKKTSTQNAKEALKQMKLEIASEVGAPTIHIDGSKNTAYQNGVIGGRVGGQMSKRLVQMGEEALLKEYNNKNNSTL